MSSVGIGAQISLVVLPLHPCKGVSENHELTFEDNESICSLLLSSYAFCSKKLSPFPWGPGSQCTWPASVLCTLQMGRPAFPIHAVQFELCSMEDGNHGETLQAKVSL